MDADQSINLALKHSMDLLSFKQKIATLRFMANLLNENNEATSEEIESDKDEPEYEDVNELEDETIKAKNKEICKENIIKVFDECIRRTRS